GYENFEAAKNRKGCPSGSPVSVEIGIDEVCHCSFIRNFVSKPHPPVSCEEFRNIPDRPGGIAHRHMPLIEKEIIVVCKGEIHPSSGTFHDQIAARGGICIINFLI